MRKKRDYEKWEEEGSIYFEIIRSTLIVLKIKMLTRLVELENYSFEDYMMGRPILQWNDIVLGFKSYFR